MEKIIVVFSMFTYDEYKLGISNTNSNIYNWLKKTNPNSKIIFVDFNRFGFVNKLKYFLKYVNKKQKYEIISSSLLYKYIKINDQCSVYKGWFYKTLFAKLYDFNDKFIEVWSFNPFINNYHLPRNSKKYFYTIDDWKKNNVFKKYSDYLEKRYQIIPTNFSKVFVNNKSLKNKLYQNQKNIFFIPNGVDTEYFKYFNQTNDEIKKEIDDKIGKITTSSVGYMGVISHDRVDYDLCEYLIKSNPHLFFIFAGPVLAGFDSKLLESKYKNVKFIGMVYFQQLPYLFSKYDVCIIPHKLNEFIQSMDPKKLYEYLAAGKPVVTTPVSGTDNFKDIISITDNKKEFSEHINTAINNNDSHKIDSRQKIAANRDWRIRFDDIKKIISN